MKLVSLRPYINLLIRRLQRAYRYSKLRKLLAWLKGKTLHRAQFMIFSTLLVCALLGWHYYLHSFFYVVYIDEHEVGLVRDAGELKCFIDDLLHKCSMLYGMEVVPQQRITFSREFRLGGNADMRSTEYALRDRMRLSTDAILVTVDNMPVVPVASMEEIDKIIDRLSRYYIQEDDDVRLIEVELDEDIGGVRQAVSPDQVYSADQVAHMLINGGEYPGMIASRNPLPARSGRTGSGEEAEPEFPVVHVKTVVEVVVDEPVPYSTTYRDNSKMYKGESRVISEGVEGRKEVTYWITYENGEEITREAVNERVIKEPVNRVVERGTSSRFAWPVAGGGRLTQGFRGSAHRGIDIAAPVGTAVLAADDGVVVKSAWGSSQGNYLILYHGSYWTLYLHNSANLVSAGSKVSRGQTIARLGSTGNSTGPHLHFEVRVNNGSGVWSDWYGHTAVNPMNFF